MNRTFIYFYIVGIVLTILSSIGIFYLFTKKKIALPSIPLTASIFVSLYLLIAHLLKYYSLHLYVDFAAWAEILNNIVSTGKPISSIQHFISGQGTNWFGAHFTPLLYIIAIPFAIYPHNETLILLNFLLMLSSVIPLYKLARINHPDERFGLFMVVLLLWYPTFQYIVLYEFEMLRFSIPIILWMLYFWEKRKIVPYFLCVLLAVLVREEVGLTIMMFGLYLLVKRQLRVGLATALIGLGSFAVITEIVMPALRTANTTEHVAMTAFRDFGDTFGKVAWNAASHPALTLTKILTPIKLANLFMLFLPLLFVSLLAPTILISVLANFGVGLLSCFDTHTSYMLYYLSPSVPFIFYAFIKGWPKLIAALERLTCKWGHRPNADVNSAAMASVLLGLLTANIFFGPSPISLQFWSKNLRPAPFRTQNFHYSIYKVTDHHRKVEQFVELIPPGAVVSAEQFLHPRLARKKAAMVFPQLESLDGKIKADYVFIDKKNPIKSGTSAVPGSWDGLRENPQSYYDKVEKDLAKWKLIKTDDGYFLYQRVN